jgi:UDP-glucose 4-epimerase
MASVAVTGGAGFVGCNLVRELVRLGHDVKVIDDLSTGLRSNLDGLNIKFHQVSITDFEHLRTSLNGSEIIFHLAARGSVPRSIVNPVATMQTNVIGTQNVLECAREFDSQVIFSSSSSVYGANLTLPKSEKMWTSPISPYAASKLAGEALMQSYARSYGLAITSFRFFNIFGPYQRPDHDYAAVIPKWIWRAMNNQPLTLFGDGEQTRDFTSVNAVVSVLISSMYRKLKNEDPINLAFGNRISLLRVIEQLQEYFPELVVEFQPKRQGDVIDSQNDPKRIHELFPEVSTVPFEDSLRETVRWFENEGEAVINGPEIVE